MEAQAWTAIGLLAATLIGALFYLGNRIDASTGRLESRIGRLESRIDGLSDRMDGRMDTLSGRIDALTLRVEEQGKDLGHHIYELARRFDEHIGRHES